MNIAFDDEVVLVAGAAGAIGSAICSGFRERHAFVIGLDRDKGGAADVNVECDVADQSSIDRAIADISADGHSPSIFVHSAAVFEPAATLDATADSFTRLFNVNVVSAVRLVQALAPAMQRAGRGSIVFISSINGLRGAPGLSAYATSKGALNALTTTLALELAPHGVRVNAIAPASIDTPGMHASFQRESDPAGARNRNVARHPLGRLGTPGDIADAVMFLSSEHASWTTGTLHLVDGGAHITRQ